MPALRRVGFRFTLRTALIFVAIVAVGLGFWLQWRDLRRAQAILAAHGLAWEWVDLKPGQARATVTRLVDSEMFQVVVVRVDTLQPAKLTLIDEKGSSDFGLELDPMPNSNVWTIEVRLAVDQISHESHPLFKFATELTGPLPKGQTMYTWTGVGKGDTVRENIDVQIKSQIFDIGDRIPLWQVYERHFDMILQ